MAAALAAAAGPPDGWGLALRSGASRTVVNGLRPGKTCPLAACAGGPLRLANTGTEPATARLSVLPPEPGGLQDGYEPAPSAAWVTLTRGEMALAPGKEEPVNGQVKVPDGKAAPGLYQLDWLADAVSPSGLRLKLRSRLLLRVGDAADEKEDADWALKRKAAARGPDAGVLLPRTKVAVRARAGRKARLSELGAAVKVANVGEGRRLVRVTVAPGQISGPEGYEPCPNPGFLKGPRRLELAPGQVAEAPLWLEVPDQPRYRGRRWAFEVGVQSLDSPEDEPQTVTVLVDTEGTAAR
jgi:hypothetical protein